MDPYVEDGYSEAGYFGPPGSLVRFSAGVETLNFERAPLRIPVSLELVQAERRNAAGDCFGGEVFGAEEVLVLSWPRLETYYLERLLDWFDRVADGMAQEFSYRDRDGVERSVRFASPEIPEILEKTPDVHAIQVALLVVE